MHGYTGRLVRYAQTVRLKRDGTRERAGGPWTPAIFLLGGETRGTEPTAVLLRSGVRPATPPNVLQ